MTEKEELIDQCALDALIRRRVAEALTEREQRESVAHPASGSVVAAIEAWERDYPYPMAWKMRKQALARLLSASAGVALASPSPALRASRATPAPSEGE